MQRHENNFGRGSADRGQASGLGAARRIARVILVVVSSLLIATCDLFAPPFVFDNPYDPQSEVSFLFEFGRRLYVEVDGLAQPDRFAVGEVSGSRFIVAPRIEEMGLQLYWIDDDRYEIIAIDDESFAPRIHDLAVAPDGSTVYAATWESIHRVNVATGAVSRNWMPLPNNDVKRIAVEPSGHVWALATEWIDDVETMRMYRISAARNVVVDRTYSEYTGRNFEGSGFAVSADWVAMSRRDHQGDILFFDLAGTPQNRLIRVGDSFELRDPTDSTFGNMNVESLAFDGDQFVALGWWQEDRRIAYFEGAPNHGYLGSAIESTSLPGGGWGWVAVWNGIEYAANSSSGAVVRLDDLSLVHENASFDELGFARIESLAVDAFVDPPLLYAIDHSYGAIHVVDTETNEFLRLFGPRGPDHGQIGRPRSVYVDAESVYVYQYGWIQQFARDGTFVEDINFPSYDMRRFVIADGWVIGGDQDRTGLGFSNASTGEGFFSTYYHGVETILVAEYGDSVLGVIHERSNKTVRIGFFDPESKEFTETGRMSDQSLERRPGGHVHVSTVAVAPEGFIWIANYEGVVVRTDTEGNVLRRVVTREPWVGSVAAAPGGTLYVGGKNRIEVYGRVLRP